MDHHSAGRFARIVVACRRCPGADAPNTRSTPNVPQIKSVRLKTVDPIALKYQFRLGDGEVDLLKAFSLDGSDGVGSAGRCRLLENSRNASGIGNGTV